MEAPYFVVLLETVFTSLDEVREHAADDLVRHVSRSNELHANGDLLMAGAFLDRPDQPIQTMGILTSREAAEAYAVGDPFVVAGKVTSCVIRPWGSILTTDE